MSSYYIDGIKYTDKLPHSRIEKIMYSILKKKEGDVDLVVDGPEDLGKNLMLVDNAITVNPINQVISTSSDAVTSHAVWEQLEMANAIMATI